ncbi:hypothetical protein ACN28E_34705 [Archangium lansingense]|uniref:hypothetical protein n=1 Tax=Archangium lansingense TaxID=2995310 RepID=UPI003B815B1F
MRRLRLWHDFREAHVRDIPFRRGLNIVSSPAGPTAQQVSTGHAAGKTLLCRQLRYCLGEDTFADPADTTAIRSRFPNGGVGAEIRLCGETWVVRRGFGSRADDRAKRGERIEDLADDAYRGTYDTFRAELESFAFNDGHRQLLKALEDVDVPWPYVLAWLTRDQECRLDGLTHWRHPESSSHSPVRKAAAETRLNVLRVALGLYSVQSNAARRRVSDASLAVSAAESEARQCEERFKVLRKDLALALNLDEAKVWPPPPVELLQDEQIALEAHVRQLDGLLDQRIREVRAVEITQQQKADEQAFEATKAEHAEVEQQIEAATDTVAIDKERLKLLSKDSSDAWAALRRAKHPTCPYDDTPIDVEKAKFVCPLPRLPDAAATKQIAEDSEELRKKVADELATHERDIAKLKGRRAALSTRIKNFESRIAAHQFAIANASQDSQAAWAAKGTLRNFVAAAKSLDEARVVEKREKEAQKLILEQKNEHLTSYSTFALTKWFDVLVKQIVAQEAMGEVSLDGKGLHATIQWRGRRRSVALNSLRIVLFDLAAMLCAVEGTSSAPAFLLHDSPREGDLDPWTYARLFETVFAFGEDEDSAPFQYIVTTTTEPPQGEIRQRVRVELSARSDATRFLLVDL